MSQQNPIMVVGNGFLKLVLRSPFHALLSQSTMLVTVTGRKSGKTYTTPVNYLRQGDLLSTISHRNRAWWKNLRGGAPATLRLLGKDVPAAGSVIEEDNAVAEKLTGFFQQAPQIARYSGIGLDEHGRPRPEDILQAAKSRVMVQFKLNGS